MKLRRNSLAIIFCFLAIASYGQGLKDYYKDYFTIGAAVTPQSLTGEEGELIKKQFNSLTAENAMKMGPIHPEENRYNWEGADKIVEFAMANKMKVRGHCLVWHRQTPDWIFKGKDGKEVTKDVLLQRLRDHIQAVVGRYKGKIYAWDVVNEAVTDDENTKNMYRESPWWKICGEDYIYEAFKAAHEADPNALLFYNDFVSGPTVKLTRIWSLVGNLKLLLKIPIHGVGIQGHWNVTQSTDDVEKIITRLQGFDFRIHITELDISVYPSASDKQTQFTPELEQKQADVYKDLFKLFRSYKKDISSVTFWNVSDKHSWLDNFPTKGRKNYPLLFDQQLKPKKAYFEVVGF